MGQEIWGASGGRGENVFLVKSKLAVARFAESAIAKEAKAFFQNALLLYICKFLSFLFPFLFLSFSFTFLFVFHFILFPLAAALL